MATFREKNLLRNSLGCLLKAVEGMITTVDLRNDNEVRGKIEHVDAYMNLTMSDVHFTAWHGEKMLFTQFFVHGANIRYVHIPDEIDMIKAIETQLSARNIQDAKHLQQTKRVQNRMERKDKELRKAEKQHKLKEDQEKATLKLSEKESDNGKG